MFSYNDSSFKCNVRYCFLCSHRAAVGHVRTMASVCQFTKRTAMCVSVKKDSQGEIANKVSIAAVWL